MALAPVAGPAQAESPPLPVSWYYDLLPEAVGLAETVDGPVVSSC